MPLRDALIYTLHMTSFWFLSRCVLESNTHNWGQNILVVKCSEISFFILGVVRLSWSGMIRCPTYTLLALHKKDLLQTSLMKLYTKGKGLDKGRVEKDAWHLASHDGTYLWGTPWKPREGTGAKPLSLDLHDVPHGPVNMCPPPWHPDMLHWGR